MLCTCTHGRRYMIMPCYVQCLCTEDRRSKIAARSSGLTEGLESIVPSAHIARSLSLASCGVSYSNPEQPDKSSINGYNCENQQARFNAADVHQL
jgi:hypothetical protein